MAALRHQLGVDTQQDTDTETDTEEFQNRKKVGIYSISISILTKMTTYIKAKL